MDQEKEDAVVAVWTRLVTAGNGILDAVEAALKARGLPPLGWYDALLEVERAGPEGIRPYELKERLLLPQYGTSRLIARVEKAGYIARTSCDADGRGQIVTITKAGRRIRRAMWPVYSDVLAGRIGARLDHGELVRLASLLDRLIA